MTPIKQSKIPTIPGTIILYYWVIKNHADNTSYTQFRFNKIISCFKSIDILALDDPPYTVGKHGYYNHPNNWSSDIKFFIPTEEEIVLHLCLEII